MNRVTSFAPSRNNAINDGPTKQTPRRALGVQSANVAAFEAEWSEWLGVRHSVFVSSGSSANLVTLAALRELRGPGELVVPSLTWVSDIDRALSGGQTRPPQIDQSKGVWVERRRN